MIGVSIPLKDHDETRLGEMNIQTDYLCAGNIIGEMGMLTGSPRNASVTCETTVQVCYVPWYIILNVIIYRWCV